ncbi:transposase [Roseovarius sp. M141]|uniref:transposase n=1 Tax=Roseovarius sp. M141 TaxID=2583806 RepID=UPI0034E96CFD
MTGRSSHKVQREFSGLRRRYWGRRCWGRGYFSPTNGAITEDIVLPVLGKTHRRSYRRQPVVVQFLRRTELIPRQMTKLSDPNDQQHAQTGQLS